MSHEARKEGDHAKNQPRHCTLEHLLLLMRKRVGECGEKDAQLAQRARIVYMPIVVAHRCGEVEAWRAV